MTINTEYFLKRRAKRITQKELADYLKCNQSLISRYEQGTSSMSKDKIVLYRQYIDNK